ncbi:type II toxin-antitoxin system VapC family toxin [soil metagenome]
MILLDTTVLAYAVGEEHALRRPARWLLEAHGSGRIEATTTVEVLQEFLHIRSRRRPHADAVRLTREFAVAFDLQIIIADDLEVGLDLYLRTPRLGAFDAMLAAVATRRKVRALVSADRAFAGVEGLPWLDLADPNLERSLTG